MDCWRFPKLFSTHPPLSLGNYSFFLVNPEW